MADFPTIMISTAIYHLTLRQTTSSQAREPPVIGAQLDEQDSHQPYRAVRMEPSLGARPLAPSTCRRYNLACLWNHFHHQLADWTSGFTIKGNHERIGRTQLQLRHIFYHRTSWH